jgi:ABC-type uncharacterized transport system auxiliary subunit
VRAALGTVIALLAACALAGCGSVTVPHETLYRLPLPRPPRAAEPLASVLRIERLSLAANVAGDRLAVADGPVALQRYELHRWAGPLDGLVLDALVIGFVRSGGFVEVKAPRDPGGDDLVLSGTILDFHEVREAAGAVGLVALDLRLVDRRSQRELFRSEFAQRVPAGAGGPEAAARALSQGLGAIVAEVVEQTRAQGVAARPR